MFNLEEKEACLSAGMQKACIRPEEVLTELWTGETVKPADGVLRAEIPAHGCVVYAVKQ